MSFITKLLVPGAVVASVLMPAAPSQAAAVVFEVRQEIPIDTTLVNPCNGEEVSFTGAAQSRFQIVINGNTFHVEQHFNVQGVHGSGSAGNAYVGSEADHVSLNGAVGAELTSTENFHMISEGSAPNFILHVDTHVTVNANGTVTVSFGDFRAECR